MSASRSRCGARSSSRSTARRCAPARARRSCRPAAAAASTSRRSATARRCTPVNACRVCMVEVEGSRVLVPSCARKVEDGMKVQHRVRARPPRAQDGARVPGLVGRPLDHAGCRRLDGRVRRRAGALRPAGAARRGRGARPRPSPATTTPATARPRPPSPSRSRSTTTSTCATTASASSATSASRAAARDWQNTFAIAVAGRGFDARIATEFAVPLPDSACVYCGNCIAVCPTGALMFKSEHDHRAAGTWDESAPDADATRSAPTAASAAI